MPIRPAAPAGSLLVSESPATQNFPEIHYSLVLACYKDAPHLLENTKRLVEYLGTFELTYELVFVEDASPDNTLEELARCHDFLSTKGIPHVVLRNEQNRGRGGTVQAGFEVSVGNVVGFIDVDLEHSPDAIPVSVARILKGECDAIVGKRFYNITRVRPLRALASGVYKRLVHMTLALPVSDTESGFKFFLRKNILPVMAFTKNRGWFWDTEIVHLAALFGLTIAEQNIVFERNPKKQSTVNVLKDSLAYLRELRAYVKRLGTMRSLFRPEHQRAFLPMTIQIPHSKDSP